MTIHTGWLSPPVAITGLDHLGTQTPCQLVYAQLLPGITNVTDRARYYSLYPWLIWFFDQRYPDADYETFVRIFRRADFLLTLIAEFHARGLGEPDFLHGAAMAGRTQMSTAMNMLATAGTVNLEAFATREDAPTRYFKQPLGGLGQYYIGTLVELGVLDTNVRSWIRYSDELGEPLARAVDAVVPGKAFWDVVDAGEVTDDDLEGLSAFCPCGLKPGTDEHRLLEALFLATGEHYIATGKQRQLSLQLLLHLVNSTAELDRELDTDLFRATVYSSRLPNRGEWQLPAHLHATRAAWAVYQLNELLSVAFLSLFTSTLDFIYARYADAAPYFRSPESVASAAAAGVFGSVVERAYGAVRFSEFLSNLEATAPPIGDWTHADHEHQVYQRLLGMARNDLPLDDLVRDAVYLLGLLAVRSRIAGVSYDGVAITRDELIRYPINLESFASRTQFWSELPLRDVVREMVDWCLSSHLTVALRKLRDTSRSTFRFYVGERGVELAGEAPVPTRTTPRFNQSLQILIDLGALAPKGGSRHEEVSLTDLGRTWMNSDGG